MTKALITPVTKQLRDELAVTEQLLKILSDHQDAGRLTDRDHYAPTVDALEGLTVAVLSATTSTPLVRRTNATAARFDLASTTPLAQHVNACVFYLRNTASSVLAAGGAQNFGTSHAVTALDQLKKLYGFLLDGIVKQVEADVTSVRKRGVAALLVTADDVANAATASDETAADEQPTTDDPAADLVARS